VPLGEGGIVDSLLTGVVTAVVSGVVSGLVSVLDELDELSTGVVVAGGVVVS
jgi:hypothetical protein